MGPVHYHDRFLVKDLRGDTIDAPLRVEGKIPLDMHIAAVVRTQ